MGVECFEQSLRSMAPLLGWDPDVVATIAEKTHKRGLKKNDQASLLKMLRPSRDFSRTSTSGSQPRNRSGWSSMVDPALVEEILSINSVDEELVRFARAQFRAIHGQECVASA